ncbi:MAG: oxygen-independent coproporphyrinogen III oxidase [Thalassobaculum sp.]|uniref:oxygen-independent coproporphyrinogen III oxidase n=1 Tax=Thalassobaculum sp. TaxID=2022740 RepID=UPI0032EAAF43
MYLERYALATLPRYTSYPPANRFDPAVDAGTYGGWLAGLEAASTLSLYVHVPFCRTLCWYCGCHTSVPNDTDRVDRYVELLMREIDLVADRIGEGRPVVNLHFGGGTPTILDPHSFLALSARLRERFAFRPDAEVAVEVDPRGLDEARIDALAEAGVTRVSLGVQDLDPQVQRAINRIQPFGTVARAVTGLRRAGIMAINADLMYGLPHQTVQHVEASARAVALLGVDRVAVFGYAHVPWFKANQRAIDEAALPGPEQRFEQAEAAARVLDAKGYDAIGFDHFARPDDPLAVAAATGRLRRNFQGYVVDPADAILGFGASSIGSLPQGYIQNEAHLKRWAQRVDAGELPVARGIAVDGDDRLVRAAIERVLCDGAADLARVADAVGTPVDNLSDAFRRLRALEADGLVVLHGWTLRCTGLGRRYLRNVAACFDPALDAAPGRHSRAV